MIKKSILSPLEFLVLEQWIDCIKGKYVKKIKKDVKRSAGILEIIHIDIYGPFSIKSMDGYDSFIDKSLYLSYAKSTWWIDSGATVHVVNSL